VTKQFIHSTICSSHGFEHPKTVTRNVDVEIASRLTLDCGFMICIDRKWLAGSLLSHDRKDELSNAGAALCAEISDS
jgi:hypothetical protein